MVCCFLDRTIVTVSFWLLDVSLALKFQRRLRFSKLEFNTTVDSKLSTTVIRSLELLLTG
jgi:hypothetical protein